VLGARPNLPCRAIRSSPTSALKRSTISTVGSITARRQYCCAGLQLEFPVQRFQEVAAAWVVFEESIVIGWT
jgi:hypothetical protein